MPLIRKKLLQKTSNIRLRMSFDPWRKRRIDIHLRRNELNSTAGSVFAKKVPRTLDMRLTREKETDSLYEAKSIDSSTLRGKTSVDSWRKRHLGICFWWKLRAFDSLSWILDIQLEKHLQNQNFNIVIKFPFFSPKESLFKILCFAVKAEVYPEQQNTLQNTCSLLLRAFLLKRWRTNRINWALIPSFRYWAVRENHHGLHLQHPFASPQSFIQTIWNKYLMDQLAWRTSVSVSV